MSKPVRYLLMLEDEPDRIERFESIIPQVAPELELKVWNSAHRMIREVGRLLPATGLISLDHDLYAPDGSDLGDGLEVATFLASCEPSCPVVIHSSNSQRAVFMIGALELERWNVHRSVPLGDNWIEEDWAIVVKDALSGVKSQHRGEWTVRHQRLVQQLIDCAEVDSDDWVRQTGQSLNGLPVGLDLWSYWFLSPDGDVFLVEEGKHTPTDVRVDFLSRMSAVAMGEHKHPLLGRLRPPRPVGSPDCECMGHKIGGAICGNCGGVGWLFRSTSR